MMGMIWTAAVRDPAVWAAVEASLDVARLDLDRHVSATGCILCDCPEVLFRQAATVATQDLPKAVFTSAAPALEWFQ